MTAVASTGRAWRTWTQITSNKTAFKFVYYCFHSVISSVLKIWDISIHKCWYDENISLVLVQLIVPPEMTNIQNFGIWQILVNRLLPFHIPSMHCTLNSGRIFSEVEWRWIKLYCSCWLLFCLNGVKDKGQILLYREIQKKEITVSRTQLVVSVYNKLAALGAQKR